MIIKKTYYPWILIIISVIAGWSLVYVENQPRQKNQKRVSELEDKLLIIEKLGTQNNQLQTMNKNIKRINEGSSKSSIDDQPRKEEQYFVVQKGDDLSQIRSINKISIQELNVVNNVITIHELKVVNKMDSVEAVYTD